MFTAAFLKHPRTPTGVTSMDYQSADSENLMKRIRTGQSDEVWKNKFIFRVQFSCFSSVTSSAGHSCGDAIFIVLFFLLKKIMCLPMVSVGVFFWCDAHS